MYYVVMQLIEGDGFECTGIPFPVRFPEELAGVLLVYKDKKKAEQDYPGAPLTAIKFVKEGEQSEIPAEVL